MRDTIADSDHVGVIVSDSAGKSKKFSVSSRDIIPEEIKEIQRIGCKSMDGLRSGESLTKAYELKSIKKSNISPWGVLSTKSEGLTHGEDVAEFNVADLFRVVKGNDGVFHLNPEKDAIFLASFRAGCYTIHLEKLRKEVMQI
ncbi:MAG: hypothetical protein MSH16_07175 [Oscillospiraceae bacterium]|nr:hypothetical protein [Oscillospiraceae bacterium]